MAVIPAPPPGVIDAGAQTTNIIGGAGGIMLFLNENATGLGVIVSLLAILVAAIAHYMSDRRARSDMQKKIERIELAIQSARLSGRPCDCALIDVIEDIIDK